MKVVLMKLKVVEVVVVGEEEEEVGVVNPVAPKKKVPLFQSLLVRLVLVLKLLLMPVLNLHLQQTTSTICPPLFKALNHSFLLPSSPSPLLVFYLSLPVELSQSRKVSKLLRTYRRTRGA